MIVFRGMYRSYDMRTESASRSCKRELKDLEQWVRDNIDAIVREALARGAQVGGDINLKLAYDGDEPYAFEENSRLRVALPPPAYPPSTRSRYAMPSSTRRRRSALLYSAR